MLDLKQQEVEAEREEELEIKQKREAAHRLALERGLSSRNVHHLPTTEPKPDDEAQEEDLEGIALTSPSAEGELDPESEPLSNRSEGEVPHSRDADEGKDPT